MSEIARLTGLVGYSGMKVPVRVATTAAITLSGLQTIDGVALAQDDRVLVKNQASSIANGIYVADSGDWSLAPDADGPYDFVDGTYVAVADGSTYAGYIFQLAATNPVTPGTSAMTFAAAAFSSLTGVTFLAAGSSAVAYPAQDKMREWVSVKDFGAVGDGVLTDTAYFQNAVNSVASGSAINLYVPAGIYKLSTSVVANGRIPSWIISPDATFTGAGTLPSLDTDNYGDKGIKNTLLAAQRGTSASINTDPSPVLFLKKVSGASATSGRNPVAIFAGERRTVTTANARMEGVFSEIVDYAGGAGTFVEGGRFHGIVDSGATSGSGYGLIGMAAGEASVAYTYLIAIEGDVENNTTDAPVVASFDRTHYSASFVATSHFGTKHPDVGFVTNPYNTAATAFRTGFLVAENSVDTDAFANRASVANGLNFVNGSYSNTQILFKNATTAIRAKNAAGSADHNILVYDSSNKVVIGTDAVAVKLAVVDNAIANPIVRDIIYGAADSGSRGAGFRALQVAN